MAPIQAVLQDIAVSRVMEAIAGGKTAYFFTLATGTGKTFIAFQLAWKLFHSRWNLESGGEPSRRPGILFLATATFSPTRLTMPSARLRGRSFSH